MYFEVFWIDTDRKPTGRLLVDMSGVGDTEVGERVQQLTQAARAVALPGGLRLRTDVHHAAPQDGDEPLALQQYLWGDHTFNEQRFRRHSSRVLVGQRPHLFQLRPGTPVEGDDLVAREREVHRVITSLESRSCHLRAPRRYGKTSLLRRLRQLLPVAVLIDVCDVASVAGFLGKLLREAMIVSETEDALRSLPELAAWPSPGAEEAFRAALDDLLGDEGQNAFQVAERVFDALACAGTVLLIDEFSLFLRTALEESEAELRQFLQLCHTLRTRPSHPLRCVVAGSAGLSAYIHFFDLTDVLEDFTPVDLEPLAPEDAGVLAEELLYGAGKRPTPEVVNEILLHVGSPIPYFVHALVHETVAQCGSAETPSTEEVGLAYDQRLLGTPGNHFFRDFLVRTRMYPAPLRKGASAVLRMLAHATEPLPKSALEQGFCTAVGESEAEVFPPLMTCLQEDYDLMPTEDGQWFMRCKVLADRWRRGEPG